MSEGFSDFYCKNERALICKKTHLQIITMIMINDSDNDHPMIFTFPDTVDGWNPAPPEMYKTLIVNNEIATTKLKWWSPDFWINK